MANSSSRLAWSKSTRIKVMIAIDTAFFLLELICGFLAHSLALTADAFHMVRCAIPSPFFFFFFLWRYYDDPRPGSYQLPFSQWVRAEILGAFFNAVFLIALCVSIILEALTRFVEPPEINNPKLILIVGCAGLFSNLLGFFVLGGHGHDHGDDHDHDHDHEEGHAHGHDHAHSHSHSHGQRDGTRSIADENGPVGDVLPEVVVRRASMIGDESNTRASRASQSRGRDHQRQSTKGHSRFSSIEDMSIHPASFRQEILAVSRAASHNICTNGSGDESAGSDTESGPNETSPLLQDTKSSRLPCSRRSTSKNSRGRRDSSVHIHNDHHHTLPIKPGSKVSGHNHADMGMNAMMLHVIGDALGNVGVIVTALIIWLTDWPGKLYADPAVSLLITAIILKTSIPLTIATSRVLLQATPENISIPHIRQDIERLPGVVSCHHIHVWQLSDTKIVASMHLQVSFPFDKNSGEKYMQLAKRARRCLHAYGIHSATIQPEFCLDNKHQHDGDAAALALDGASDEQLRPCLLECVDDCQAEGCCIVESSSACSSRRDSASSHEEHQHQH
ncbi:cation efflux protein [Trichoderma longibrachiatum ATCC 18648]|uniref:Cation efflux protein n=1 Tax=Trichoderma longibrachiatum ATCC 18648 TaxID=983965 RepID=A0A2T4BXM0_TRILO|nr:cation efflux protein [Trichoderma longibrachiatum ATCC 18648]